jgi:hypothetical protein
VAVVSDLAGVEPAASRKETVQTTAEVKNVAEAAQIFSGRQTLGVWAY